MEKKRKLLFVNIAVLGVAALLYAALISPEGVMTMSGSRRYPVYRGQAKDSVSLQCAVTWDAQSMKTILDTLDEYGVSITFAVSGEWANAHPTLLCEIASRGHEIAAMRQDPSKGGYKETLEELSRTADSIERITGRRPELFYCGPGNDTTAAKAGSALGLTTVLGTLDLDCSSGPASSILERADKIPGGGSIILTCPTSAFSEALPYLIEKIKNMGLDIVPTYKILYNNNGKV